MRLKIETGITSGSFSKLEMVGQMECILLWNTVLHAVCSFCTFWALTYCVLFLRCIWISFEIGGSILSSWTQPTFFPISDRRKWVKLLQTVTVTGTVSILKAPVQFRSLIQGQQETVLMIFLIFWTTGEQKLPVVQPCLVWLKPASTRDEAQLDRTARVLKVTFSPSDLTDLSVYW